MDNNSINADEDSILLKYPETSANRDNIENTHKQFTSTS